MKFKWLSTLLTCVALLFTQVAVSEEQDLTPEQVQFLAQMEQIWNTIDRQTGEISLLDGVSTLKVPDNFYYLNPTDSEKVLVDIWGNPPGASQGLLGMLFPADSKPYESDTWGVTIEYKEDGYVSDEDADEIDYDELLSIMKEETAQSNEQRISQGYEPVELVGWASAPFYDKTTHKMHWAKEIKFGDATVNTLNYNIRVLGRKGVLVLNFIADIDQKQLIDSQLNNVLAMAEFKQGSRYDEFDPDIDQVAAYGIGALIAGKVIAKTGFLAVVLIFLKKFGIFIILGIGAFLRRLFKRNKA